MAQGVWPAGGGPAEPERKTRGTPPPFDPQRLAASSSEMIAVQPPSSGTLLCNRYRLEAVIARGATALLYRATDELLGEPVAVKVVLHDGLLATPQAKAIHLGLKEEAILAMRLSHPRILRVFTYERHQPWEFLVMELVPGENLVEGRARRVGGRYSTRETLQIGVECLEALAYAHDVGVLHNDIKPDNILLTRAGATKLCDFGLARLAAVQAIGRGMPVIGTPAFMCPERILGQQCDARSDLYSLAATLWALAAGAAPFGRGDEALAHHVNTTLPAAPHLAAPLADVPRVALSKRPQDRFESAVEMRDALATVLDRIEEPVSGSVPLVAGPVDHEPGDEEVSVSVELTSDVEVTDVRGASVADRSNMVRIGPRKLTLAQARTVALPSFFLDRTPVTNEEYGRFLSGTGAAAPAHWFGDRPPAGKADHPVVGITLDEARSYAAWCGKRLPTTLEWEAAARGESQRSFPWGDTWDPGKAVCPESGATGTASVGSRTEGASAEGLLHLVGNVWEWTEPDARLPPDPESAWVMGGSFRHPCSVAGHIPRTAVSVAKSYEYLGFRCALSPDEEL